MQRKKEDQLAILILGAGAVGCYLGASLALNGHSIVTLEREHNAELLRKQGFYLTIGERTHHLENIAVVTSIEEALKFVSFDAVFIAVKSYDTAAVISSLAPHSAQLPAVVCFQNGVENEATLIAALGASKVIAGTVTTAVAKEGPGKIRLQRLRGVGLAANHALSKRLAAAMNAAGLNARLYADANAMKWSKLLTNLLANATSAILDMTPAEVFAHPGLYRLEIEQLREALRVMAAQKLRVVDLPGTPVRLLALGARLPPYLSKPLMQQNVGKGRGAKMPSFHIDLHSGRGKSEVSYLNGAVVRFGERLGVPAPVNRLLNETLLALSEGKMPLELFSHNPERLLRMIGDRG